MNCILKQYDTPLLKFSATTDSSEPEIEITWINQEAKDLLPLDLKATPDGVNRWLRHRTIPKNRAYVHDLLAKRGLNLNRPMGILAICKGLSLNDCYWVAEEGDDSTFDAINLYDNRFSRVLSSIALTGYGSSVRSGLTSSPEFTTNGMLRKCWRRVDGKIYLYKGGTEGFSNTGYEPYSEFYAMQVAQAMGIHAVEYGLSKWKGILCSTCELFTSKEYSFIPAGRMVTRGGMKAVSEYYAQLGPEFVTALNEMIVLDAVICNTDRHFGNFGFLIDNKTNKIAAPAPLFDHGNSLFNFAGEDYWNDDAALENYIATLAPAAYDGFLETAKAVLQPEQREQLRTLLDFRFKKHSRYNLPERRLHMIECQIRKRAGLILA